MGGPADSNSRLTGKRHGVAVRHASIKWFGVLTAAVAVAISFAPPLWAAGDTLSGKGSTTWETGLGDLAADAIRAQCGSDMAFVPASFLRSVDLPLKGLNASSVTGALADPDEPLQVLTLTGAQIRRALERSVCLLPKTHAGFLQISGITFQYDGSQAAGKRIGDILQGRKPISDSQSYTVAMPGSLASGSLGYFRVWGDTKPDSASHGSIEDAIEKLFASKPDLTPYQSLGRIHRI